VKIPGRNLTAGLAVLVIAGGSLLAVVTADAATIPIDQVTTGKATYYNDAGYGACGRSINASSQMLVAVSYTYWTSSNPNNDPLCTGISVQVSYSGKTLTVPVEDKCPSCDATHIDLSQPAFAQLGSLDLGVLNGLTWKFVSA